MSVYNGMDMFSANWLIFQITEKYTEEKCFCGAEQ